MKKVLCLIVFVALVAASGCSTASHGAGSYGSSAGTPSGNASTVSTGTIDDWMASVCKLGRYRNMGDIPVPRWMCSGNPEGSGFTTLMFIAKFLSQSEMHAHPEVLGGRYSYASCMSDDGSVVVFVSDVSGVGSKSAATQLTDQSLQPLTKFGCTITEENPYQSPRVAQPTPQPQPAAPTPAWTAAPTPAWTSELPAPTSTQPSLPDADTHGFVNYPRARCNSTNPAVAIARTAQSMVVICQTGAGRFYYRGFGLQNGLSVEIDDPVRSGAGFVATNNGVQYSVSSDALTITQGSETLSNEPMLEYWSQ